MDDKLRVVEVNENPGIAWCWIFNSYEFYTLHSNKSCYFTLIDGDSNVIGVTHFSEIEPGIFKSPSRGTFAGFQLKENNLEHLVTFVEQTEEQLKQKGAKKITVAAAPFHHKSGFSSHLFNTLLNKGFEIENQDLNYAISVDGTDLIDKMNRNNKKRLRKCINDGFTFAQVNQREEYLNVYQIIETNRKSKGYPITMTYQQIMEMVDTFPTSMYFFKASKANQDIASSICIRIDSDILYVFYWGDLPGYEQHSPVSFLADGIYRFAQANNFKMVDAGISTVNGVPNFGLIRFKENLGFTESIKLTYSKTLSS